MYHNKIINLIPSAITVVSITLSTMMALSICGKYNTSFVGCLISVPAYYLLCRILYFGCNKLAERIVSPFANVVGKYVSRKQREAVEEALSHYKPTVVETDTDAKDVQCLQGESACVTEECISQSQCCPENIIIKEQIKRDEFEKLEQVLTYTRNIFFHLGFGEGEVTQIVECVRYFVCNKNVLCPDILCIKRKNDVTSSSLENFGWNISRQYSIDGITTAQFVKYTFKEWFKDTDISSIVKTLRNTKGHHAVEIDPNILKVRA